MIFPDYESLLPQIISLFFKFKQILTLSPQRVISI